MLIRDVCSNHVKFDTLLDCPCLFIREIQYATSPCSSEQQGDGFKLQVCQTTLNRTEAKIFIEILLFGISVIDYSLSVIAVLIYGNFVEVASSKEFGFKQKT